VISILATVVILGVLIFVHELGHFATAKWAGIDVPRFSIGLGPKMTGFTRGGTEFVISWIPLGGYVRMAGMDDMEALEGGEYDAERARQAGRSFESKSLPVRAVVIAAGVVMNVLFAWFLYTVIALAWGVRTIPEPVVGDVLEERVPAEAMALLDIPVGARIATVNGQPVADFSDVHRFMAMARDTIRLEFENAPPVTVPVPSADAERTELIVSLEPRLPVPAVVGQVAEGSPAEQAGLREGDRVVAVDGEPIALWQDLVAALETRPGEAVGMTVERDRRRVEVTVIPEPREIAEGRTVGRVGIGRTDLPRERLGPVAAAVWGGQETIRITRLILDFLRGLFTGAASPRDVGGPILIYQITDQVARIGFVAFLDFMALFSINLAILNLLPIPILDGGQLVFLAVEGIRGKALSVEQRMRLSQLGLVLIVAIMVWALANDFLRLFGL
jgi:regulator of sigma E protease